MKKTVAVLALALGMSFGASTFAVAQSWNSNAPRVAPYAHGTPPGHFKKQRQVQRQVQRHVQRQLQREYRRQYHGDRRDRGYRGDRYGYRDGYGRSGYYGGGSGYYYN